MTAFMEYVYMQQEKPTDTKGVPISLDVIDDNGNYRHIGDATSDASGKFALTWTPDIEGDYTVIATFCGSESYYGSSDEAFFTAAVPQATPTQQQTQTTSTDPMITAGIIGILVAIVVVGIVLALLITRKRP
jgi:hypothetical protein